ncbi:hypothetical protein TNCV_2249451 [Trichonephila clavipes]|nr:hypothetical protein TNCV_2249451 [Trichonephila clavipes]
MAPLQAIVWVSLTRRFGRFLTNGLLVMHVSIGELDLFDPGTTGVDCSLQRPNVLPKRENCRARRPKRNGESRRQAVERLGICS